MRNIIDRAKLALQNKVIFKPDPSIEYIYDLFSHKKGRSVADYNDGIFVTWLKKILNEYNTNNVLCLYMNSSNLEVLNNSLNPMTYLNLSPKEDDSLEDDELMIDLNEAKNE